jgi:ELWxxDGT repeat protein
VGSNVRELKSVNGLVYFVAIDGENNPELWRTNGKANVQWVEASYSNSNTLPPMYLYQWKNALYFVVDDAQHGAELWVVD